ncbi:hypothetical protein [Roseibium litorale]|uniref:Uncharacterized protein n=1 Tax=Roseibium litorale TaxID=2803841 RepID=A0ABR9CM36_9HYPH|nr:hypothetical protein [Roseibium litorale]MBD8891371.1 hypothetical protein [Roseibium litorale]
MEEPNKSVLVDIDIPFARLVMIMIKFSLAAIPAMIVVWLIMAVIMLLFGGLFGGLMGGGFMHMRPGGIN